tara:strand:- start:432 stop:986 length:555 start_codon:yes stop_codon:yes gene_type:complete
MAQKFRQVNEGLDWVFQGKGKKEQIDRLKELAANNQTIVPLVRWGVGAEIIDWGLPEGMPDGNKIQDDIPDGMGETTILLEWRRIKSFTDPESNMKNLPQWKQEMSWLQILEGVHHKEADLLTHVKDRALIVLYPKLEGLLKDLGITKYDAVTKKTKKAFKAKDTSKKMEELKAKVDFTETPTA